jgi:CRP/FNR family transcriptional regulator
LKDFQKQYNFLEKELLDEIRGKGVVRTFRAGESLIREGQFITSFPLILKGLIRISRTSEQGNELLLYYLRENEVCAMSLTCCMASLKSSVMAFAEEETEVIMLPVALLDEWMCKYQTWKQFVMQSYQLRFRELIETVDSLAFMKLDERLENFFKTRHLKSGETSFYGTHQYLALQLNTSREVVSRLLKKLENEGRIELSRNFIDFHKLL